MVTTSIVVDFANNMNDWLYFDKIPRTHPIADADVLYDAYKAARKGSHWKAQVQRFRWNVLTEVSRLQKELVNFEATGTGYKLSPYSRFTVNERGKIRAITALSMRDRVVKHALNDCFLIPDIRKHLIYDNGASLKGKGVGFTRKRLITHLESFYRETGSNDGYILVMDFSGYYDNIDHNVAMQMINAYEPDPFARTLVKQAYDSYNIDVSYMTDEEYEMAKHSKFSMVEYRTESHEKIGNKFLYKSMSVGDQTSQITAVGFPTPIDKLVKTICGQKYYARYMDDLYVITHDKETALLMRDKITAMAKRLKLFINPKKTKIQQISKTFTFLQNKYFLTDTGHCVVRINPKTLTRMRHKLKKLSTLVQNGETTYLKVEEMFRSWIANYSLLMSKRQRENIIELYRNLFGNDLDMWLSARNLIT